MQHKISSVSRGAGCRRPRWIASCVRDNQPADFSSTLLPPPEMNGLDPRSRWNATSLALLGDSVWEVCPIIAAYACHGLTLVAVPSKLYYRRKYYSKAARVTKYQEKVGQRINNVAQAELLATLLAADFFTPQEAAIVQWATNSSTVKPPRHLDTLTYKRATALEAIVAYLYLTDLLRLQQLFQQVDALSQQASRGPPLP